MKTILRRFALASVLAVFAFPASADYTTRDGSGNIITVKSGVQGGAVLPQVFLTDAFGTPISGTNPIATIAGPSSMGGSVTLAVTQASDRVAYPALSTTYPSITLINYGTTTIYYKQGTASVVATTSDIPLPPGLPVTVKIDTGASYVAAIADSGQTASLTVFQATGPVTSGGGAVSGGGGGGGGGTSSNFNAPFPSVGTAVGMSVGGNMVPFTGTGGNLNIQCANCSGSGVSAQDQAAFAPGASLLAPGGGFYQTTATNNQVSNGQQGMFQMTAQRALFTNLRNASGTEIGTTTNPINTALGAASIAAGAASDGWDVQVGPTTATAATAGGTGSVNAKLRLATTQLQTVITTLGSPMQQGGSVTISGTLPAFAVTPTFNLGTLNGAATAANQSAIRTPVAPNTATATGGVLMGGQYDITQKTVSPGQQAAYSMSPRGALFVATGAEALTVTGSGGTFPVTQSTNPWIVTGPGTAGTPAPGVVTVQGDPAMSPVLSAQSGAWSVGVTGTVAATQSGAWTVNPTTPANWGLGATAAAVPANAVYGGISVAGNLRGATGLALGSTYSQTVAIVDAAGNQITSFGSAANVGATGATAPTSAGLGGMVQSGNLIAFTGTSGNLNVQCANCSGSGVSTADGATFTAGASLFAGTGGFYQTTATANPLTDGQQGMAQMTAQRALFSNLRNASGAEIGVAGAELFVGGRGTAGSAAGGVLSIQGVASMTPVLTNPGTAANWGIGATAAAVPANGLYAGINVAGNLRGLTGASRGSEYAASVQIVDAAGAQVTSFGGSNASVGTLASTAPTSGTYIGYLSGANLVGVSASNPLPVVGAGIAKNTTYAAQTGSVILGLVNTAAPTGGADGNLDFVSLTTSREMRVSCSNCGGGGGGATDGGTFTAGSSTFAPGGGFYQTTATANPLTNGQYGMWQMTAQRAGFVNVRSATGAEVGTSGSPFYVSVTNLAATGSAGSPSTAVGTVQGITNGTPVPVGGDAASGASDVGNPVKIGGVYVTPQITYTTGQRVNAAYSARGAAIVVPGVENFAVQASQAGAPWTTRSAPGAASISTAATSFGASGNNTVVTRVTGTIKVYSLILSCASEVDMTMKNGTSTAMSGILYGVKNIFLPYTGEPYYTTTGSNNFVIELGATFNCGGTVGYLDN